MQKGDPQIRKHGLLKRLRPGGGCFDPQLLILLHRRTDHEALVPFRNLLADKGIDPGTVALSHQKRVHRFPPGGQFVQNRYIQIAVHE